MVQFSISTVEARNQFADLINRVAYGKERVILTRRGKALVAVVPLDDLRSSDPSEGGTASKLSISDTGNDT
ncbi:type II toxin-antitoxin system Phd/YefM family antitoxin [Leptolyngbya sp. GB1-A1]|uniref:type II toxin-antitoxin system Phd/YefM family antitoxin n=1 Tax=Leptolyngbya sp. GB1-A1 TaxID=2933908 RepID=UPI0032986EDD